jgi:hypothetical protein
MSTIEVKAQLSFNELLQAIGQLSSPELDEFVARALAVRAQRHAPSLPHNEAELLRKINEGLPAAMQQRYDQLIAKRRAETLSDDAHAELLRLTESSEELMTRRVGYLVELAQLRQTTLKDLMRDLGIQTPAYE